MAIYKVLADKVIQDIEQNRLPIGQRMPSVRAFSVKHDVSLTTVLNCYHSLQEQGYLKSKPQSGFYVSKPFSASAVPIMPYFKVKAIKMASQPNVAVSWGPFHIAQLSPELVPSAQLNRCMHRGYLRANDDVYQYPEPQGQIALRQALANHFNQHYFPVVASKLTITQGCIDAIRTAIEVTTQYGSTVAVSSPCFNGLLSLLRSMGRSVIEIPFIENIEGQQQLDIDQLEQLMQDKSVSACLLSANYINPQGFCLSVAQKQRLAALAQVYEIPLIEDDIFLELSYSAYTPLPIKHWDRNGWILWCGSISKSIAPGYRLGWCDPGRFFTDYLQQRIDQCASVNQPVQNALFEFINSGLYEKHLKKVRLILSAHASEYRALLRAHLPAAARVSQAEGGLVIWVQIPGLNAAELLKCTQAIGITFPIGEEFSSRQFYQDSFRINIGWSLQSTYKASETIAQESIFQGTVETQLMKICAIASQLYSS